MIIVLVLGGLLVTATGAVQDPYKREPPVDRTTPILDRMTPAQREHALKSLSCESDAVFTGFVQKGESFPTENGQMILPTTR